MDDRGRVFAIGDIHGCSTALRALLAAIGPRPDDTLVVLGDFIDWGPDSNGVVEQLIDLAGRCTLISLRGNHEEMLLESLEARRARSSWLSFGGRATLESYDPVHASLAAIPPRHVRFIEGCREYHETETHIFVHANYDPDRPMSQLGAKLLRWEFLDPARVRPHCSGKTVVVGHTPQTSGEVLDLGFVIAIDTDCSRGGWLTAIEVASRAIIRANNAGRVESLPGTTH
jgi:serine/threonine protein phosphatase 1